MIIITKYIKIAPKSTQKSMTLVRRPWEINHVSDIYISVFSPLYSANFILLTQKLNLQSQHFHA